MQPILVPITLPEWFGKVADRVFVGDIRVRRYFPAFVEACKVVALIRSFRRRGADQKLQKLSVNFVDFAIASILFEHVFVESLHRSADRNLETRQAVERIWRRTSKPASAAGLAKELTISKDRAYARLRRAHEAGSIRQANKPERGNRKFFVPAPIPNFLPNHAEVFEQIRDIGSPVKFVHPLTGDWLTFHREAV